MAKITIFGLAGTGKGTTAKLLCKEIQYENISTGNLFREMAAEHGMNINEFDALANTDEKYDKELDNRTKSYGETHNNFVFESRLAWYFIPDSFKIKLECDFETRTTRIAEREHKPLTQVQEETNHREDMIFERYEKYYGVKNITNDSNFDFIVDTKVNNAEQVFQIILAELKKRNIV